MFFRAGQALLRDWRRNTSSPLSPHRVVQVTAVFSHQAVLQAQRNKQAHILHGNTPIRLQWQGSHIIGKVQLELAALVPEPKQITYSRDLILKARPIECQDLAPSAKLPLLTPIQTTPLLKGSAQTATPNHRSGKRRTFIDDSGRKHFYRSSKPKVLRTTPPQQRIQRTHRIHNLTNRRAPPPRGTPGAEQADEECTPPDKEPHAQSRGSGRQQCLVCGAGSRTPAPCSASLLGTIYRGPSHPTAVLCPLTTAEPGSLHRGSSPCSQLPRFAGAPPSYQESTPSRPSQVSALRPHLCSLTVASHG